MAGECTRREFVALAGAGVGAASCVSRATETATPARDGRPNIIVLVTDDQRWDAMGCAGNPIIHTPQMDKLAADGVLFLNNFCTTSICMVSRASILTGLYKRRHKVVRFNQPLSNALFAKSYPVLMRASGYRTGFVGKWGLGGALPEDAFDYFDGFPAKESTFTRETAPRCI